MPLDLIASQASHPFSGCARHPIGTLVSGSFEPRVPVETDGLFWPL